MTSALASQPRPTKKLSFAKATTATISVNGAKSTVLVGKSFPSAAPVFSLVSMTGSSAEIGIAGGSYESGAATVTLTKGKTVTLLNTADGTRYVLRLAAAAEPPRASPGVAPESAPICFRALDPVRTPPWRLHA